MNLYYRIEYKDGTKERLVVTRHEVLGKEYCFILPDGSERRVNIEETKLCICTGLEPTTR